MKQFLSAGKIINIHGYKGTLKLESWCNSPKILASLPTVYLDTTSPDPTPHRVLKGSVLGNFVLLTLEGIDSEQKANALRGKEVYAKREDIPRREGEFFLSDMIGLPIIDAQSGVKYGTLLDVLEGVASRLYEIQTPHGKALMPEVKEFIDRIDPESGIYVKPIPGMLDGAAEEIRENPNNSTAKQ